MSFTRRDWEELRDTGDAVWILYPQPSDESDALARYLAVGVELGGPEAYKCTVRKPWWRPPVVRKPDLFFTYMSHRYPRLVANTAGVTFVNSMHGVRLTNGPEASRLALPLLAMNSVSMLGAELFGRSYGGGILKMEPREAARLPLPKTGHIVAAWKRLERERRQLDHALRAGEWSSVVARVDEVLLRGVMKLSAEELGMISTALNTLRKRRISRDHSLPAQVSG
jgi:hypothetical protein